MATHSSVLAWRIPGTGEPRGLPSVGLHRVGHDWSDLAAAAEEMVENLPAMQETWVQSLGWEDPLEKDMATHSSILAWRIPWTEKPGVLQSMGSQRVGHDWVTHIFTFLFRRDSSTPILSNFRAVPTFQVFCHKLIFRNFVCPAISYTIKLACYFFDIIFIGFAEPANK